MNRSLAWIAVGGIAVGCLFLFLSHAVRGDGFGRRIDRIFLSAGACSTKGGEAGSGQSERRWTWDGGDTVEISVPATVHYRGGEGNEVIARGPANAIAHIEVGAGTISSDCDSWRGSQKIDITLPGRPFHQLVLSGSGDLFMENVNQSDLALRLSGSGNMRVRGNSDEVTVTIDGSGGAELANLAMKRLKIDINGSGKAEAAPQDEADISIAGSGDVRLLSHPAQLRSHIAGSGRITQASE